MRILSRFFFDFILEISSATEPNATATGLEPNVEISILAPGPVSVL